VTLPEEARKFGLDSFRLNRPHLEQDRSLSSVAQTAGISYRTAHRTPCLLTQIQRILEINTLAEVTKAVVEAARESLVIGAA
jgi:hypothetical protein